VHCVYRLVIAGSRWSRPNSYFCFVITQPELLLTSLAGSSRDKFVVPSAGAAYDARVTGPNCSAGVSPAIFLNLAHRKNTGETPGLRKPAFHRRSDEIAFAGRLRCEKCRLELIRFQKLRYRLTKTPRTSTASKLNFLLGNRS
jgi:hypothetical protein